MSRAKILIIALLLCALGAAGITAFSLYCFAARSGAPTTVIVDIRPGSSLARIAGLLEEQQALNSARKFILLNRLLGSARRLRAGEYEFPAGSSPLAIIEMLSQGQVRQHFFTIPEGFTRQQIGARLAALEICQPREFEQLTTDPVFLQKFGISAASAEGYLFPETYSYTRPANGAALIAAMLRTGQRELTEIAPDTRSVHRLLTLASIIQKEAGSEAEMPLIASVFHNRLQKNMRLESDPTTIYGLGDNFDGNLRRPDLRHPSPYNTYRHRGLPPGPICSPGRAALQAAARPAVSDFFYFVSRNDGSHQFSRTLAEHRRAVRQYQLKK